MDDKLQRKEMKAKVKLETLRNLNRDRFIQAALRTEEGRDYFYWLLEICSIGRNPFSTDVGIMAFNCGGTNVGQQVQAHIIEASPDAYLRMLTDRQKEEVSGRRDSDDDNGDDNGNSGDDDDSSSS